MPAKAGISVYSVAKLVWARVGNVNISEQSEQRLSEICAIPASIT